MSSTRPRILSFPIAVPDYETEDGIIVYKYFSFDEEGDNEWHPAIDLLTGNTFCDCHDTYYRKNGMAADEDEIVVEPFFWIRSMLCKHRLWLVDKLTREGKLDLKDYV